MAAVSRGSNQPSTLFAVGTGSAATRGWPNFSSARGRTTRACSTYSRCPCRFEAPERHPPATTATKPTTLTFTWEISRKMITGRCWSTPVNVRSTRPSAAKLATLPAISRCTTSWNCVRSLARRCWVVVDESKPRDIPTWGTTGRRVRFGDAKFSLVFLRRIANIGLPSLALGCVHACWYVRVYY